YSRMELHVSPARPLAVLIVTRSVTQEVTKPDGSKAPLTEQIQTLYLLNESGRLGAHFVLPKNTVISLVQWNEAGYPFALVHENYAAKGRWFSVNPRTADLAPVEKPITFGPDRPQTPPAPNLPLRVKPAALAAKE